MVQEIVRSPPRGRAATASPARPGPPAGRRPSRAPRCRPSRAPFPPCARVLRARGGACPPVRGAALAVGAVHAGGPVGHLAGGEPPASSMSSHRLRFHSLGNSGSLRQASATLIPLRWNSQSIPSRSTLVYIPGSLPDQEGPIARPGSRTRVAGFELVLEPRVHHQGRMTLLVPTPAVVAPGVYR